MLADDGNCSLTIQHSHIGTHLTELCFVCAGQCVRCADSGGLPVPGAHCSGVYSSGERLLQEGFGPGSANTGGHDLLDNMPLQMESPAAVVQLPAWTAVAATVV
jgi:hypothetical protein